MLTLLLACTPVRDVYQPAETDTADTGPTGGTVEEHCGTIEADTTWRAGREHRVTCDVVVARGTLTVEGTVAVSFDERTGLRVGTEGYAAGLVVDGARGGVSFGASGSGGWSGLEIGDLATASIAGLVVRDATGGVVVEGAEVSVLGLGIDGAGDAGLTLSGGARLAEGSEGLTVTHAGGYAVVAEVGVAHTLPVLASSYTGNGTDAVYLSGDELTESVTWRDLGVPFVIAETVDVGGTAGEPAVFTLGEGVELRFERDRGLRFSRQGDASQLVVDGTLDNPVRLAGLGADTAGYWRGISVATGASEVRLAHLELSGAGEEGDAALAVTDADLWVDGLTVNLSAGAGVALDGRASFSTGSQDLVVTGAALPLRLAAAAVASLPTTGIALTGNTSDAVAIVGGGEVSSSGTWPNPGVPYWVVDDVEVNGTAESPAVLTVAAGVELRFDNDAGIFVGRDGAAGLRVAGTAESPVAMGPWSANVPGAWAGIGLYGASLDSELVLSHASIGYAGGSSLKGNVHVVDASPSLESVVLHDGLEWGLYLSGSAVPSLTSVSYANNASGECNACP